MITYLRHLPGPVAAMAGWSLIIFLDLVAVTWIAPQHANPTESAAWITGAAFELVVVVVCVVAGSRTPLWFLRVVLFARLVSVVFLAAVGCPIDSLLFGYATAVFVVVYAAYFWHNWLTYFYAFFAAVAMLLLGFIPETIDRVIQTWFVVTSLLVLMSVGLNRVVREQERQAKRDSMTDLPNRVALDAYLTAHPRPGRAVEPQALVVIDLDRFKDVNDSQGHAAGDRLLRETAAVWRAALRPDDLLFRVGGDEFLLILPQTTTGNADELVARLREVSPGPLSYGVTEWRSNEDFDTAFALADRRMYQDKESRREASG
jgi:diguanylate cyclase (GGDEF)-like protein